MNKFCIVAKKDEKSVEIENRIEQELCRCGWEINKENPELIICVGGDGTFLHAIHKYMKNINDCCFLAIHTGTLGFFTDYTSEEIDECIYEILHNEPTVKHRSLLEIEYDNNKYYALNEMRIENIVRTQTLNVNIDGYPFETFRGTGMCVSTQSGSTAYNRSLKGAVIEEGLDLLQLHEITGIHHRKYSSLGVSYIMSKEREIEFTSNSFDGAIMIFDTKHVNLSGKGTIKVSISYSTIKMAEYKKINYLDRLRDLY